MINHKIFYETVKATLFRGSLSQLQVDSIEAILDNCDKLNVTDIRQTAYIFATAYIEASNPHFPALQLTPIKEYGGERYLKSKEYYPYFGRGFSQITHLYNYEKEAARLGIDLVKNPDLMLDVNIAANSHVFCMQHGVYTTKKLSDYINATGCNFASARKIINGMNRAEEIAGIARTFLAALLKATSK